MFTISVFGIGYVGAVSAACLARDGHNVIAVDINQEKVDAINEGISPIIEPGLQDLIKATVASGHLSATTSVSEALSRSELSFVCVGTPQSPNGALDTSFVSRVAEEIGYGIGAKTAFHSIVFRSTLLPGTMRALVIPALERTSRKTAGLDFGIAYFPEFLREGSALADYESPGAIILGVQEDGITLQCLKDINKRMPVQSRVMSIHAAEAVKYANNAWHATKISFANEIGLICKSLGVDSFEVMEAVVSDLKLNVSSAYLKPGFAFGGSCLPKDLNALRYAARQHDIETPMLDGVLEANENQIRTAFRLVTSTGKRKIGIVGLSFKPETDDLRYSPLVELAERLIGRGYELSVYDPIVKISQLTGTNRDYLMKHLPHIADLLRESFEDVIDSSDVIVIGNRATIEKHNLQTVEKIWIDLVRVRRDLFRSSNYHGICW